MDRPALDDPLEAAELGDVELRVADLAGSSRWIVILRVALDPGDRVDDDLAASCVCSSAAEPRAARVRRRGPRAGRSSAR